MTLIAVLTTFSGESPGKKSRNFAFNLQIITNLKIYSPLPVLWDCSFEHQIYAKISFVR